MKTCILDTQMLQNRLCLIFLFFIGSLFFYNANAQSDYPWLDSVLSDNCCTNQTATVYDNGSYAFVHVESNPNCTSDSKLYFEDGTCWCSDRDGTACLASYGLTGQTGVEIFNCDGAMSFTPFDQFEWLSSVADDQDCTSNPAINVYLALDNHYIHVIGQDGFGQLYTQSGLFLCADQENYNCLELYQLSEVNRTISWTCGDVDPSDGGQVTVYNSFEDGTLTGGQQAFYGAAGPTAISEDVEFPQFINFYDIDFTETGMTMTLFNNSDAADLLLPEGRFDRYYFNIDQDMTNVNITGGSAGLTVGAKVTPLPAGYEIPLADLFGTGYPLPITLPNGGFVLELGGGTDLTELGQTISVDFGTQDGVTVYNSFEDETLTGGQQAFYGAAGPTAISEDVEFPQFINFYDIDVQECGLTMTLFNNSDAADLLLPDGRFDRYYFNLESTDVSNVSISGGSPGLAANASVTPLPPGYEIPLADLFGTGYPLPITLPDGGFVLQLAGGTDLTELGQTISVDFGCPAIVPESLVIEDEDFFPEDIVIANNTVFVSGLGDGTVRTFDLTQENPMSELFIAAEEGFTQRWGLKTDGNILLSLLDNANFAGGPAGPSKLGQYNASTGEKTGVWDLPEGVTGHTVSMVGGKYYVTDFNTPQIFEVDPAAGTVDLWFTSDQWDPSISGIGGTIYNNDGGFYVSQGNKLWYLPIDGGQPGILQEVSVSGLDGIDADGISWDDANNTLYYATNDTGDPANVGTAYKLAFSDAATATGSIVTTGLDDSSGLWYYTNGGEEYVFVMESQFGALFGLNSFEAPFTIQIIKLD